MFIDYMMSCSDFKVSFDLTWHILICTLYFCLQELGDVENWAKSIETDMRTISSALEYAYKSE